MKKATVLILFVLFFCTILYSLRYYNYYKVLGVENAASFYLDLNKNGQIDDDELVDVYGLQSFTFDGSQGSNFLKLKLNKKDRVYLTYFSKKWAEEKLLNKYVKLKFVDKNSAAIFWEKNDYAKNILKEGYAFPKNNIDSSYLKYFNENSIKTKLKDVNHFVLYNNKNKKYHELDCKYGLMANDFELVKKEWLPKDSMPCKYCHLRKTKYIDSGYFKNVPTHKSFGGLKIYFLDFSNTKKPLDDCKTDACISLLKEINDAKSTIDFAVYGIYKQPKIYDSIVRASKRGVKIRWVTDFDSKGGTYYPDTLKLMKVIPQFRADNEVMLNSKDKNAIMHNKFFIFDGKKVWTGSANITDTDFSDFNANNAILIDSAEIAEIYSNEFNQMYGGKFHRAKNKVINNREIVLGKNSKLSVYFSPQDLIITTKIVKLIDNSKEYIYIPIFYLTSKPLAKSLINAQKRGVDVRVITDATNAGGKYSVHSTLRKAGIKVKTENKAGKMHMKTIVVDDKYSVIGSMNFTKSGETSNDENVIIIENPEIARYLKLVFIYLWKSIPEKYLKFDPPAESIYSIGSCSDGIDNDFDGKIDNEDDLCTYRLVKKH